MADKPSLMPTESNWHVSGESRC